jgi:Flp pilus assembly protein TadG
MFGYSISRTFLRAGAQARRFAWADQGNIAVIFGIAIIPIIVFIGATIDYSRANAARSSMQAAMDSAVLMVSKDLSAGTITTADISSKAQAYFKALYPGHDVPTFTATYTAGAIGTSSTVAVTATSSIKTDFMYMFSKIAGVDLTNMSFSASSTSAWGATLVRVALVLDNTGSMINGGKMDALQLAAPKLVDQLAGMAQNTGDVMISVIPFALDVNVGNTTANQNASWMRWDLWDPLNTIPVAIIKPNGKPGTKDVPICTIVDGVNHTTDTLPMAVCLGHNLNWSHTPDRSDKSLWNGCVTDRERDFDVTADAPTSDPSTKWIADQAVKCPVSILPLTTNWNDVKNKISAMVPTGQTNQTIGLQWGWLSLLQQAPLNAPAESATSIYQHVIILFSDGLNSMDQWYGDGRDGAADVDGRMRAICDKIKTQIDPKTGKPKFTIFTVQVDTDGAGQSPVLPYCASSPANFYMLTDPTKIGTAFTSIGTEIAKLRVSK